MLRKSSITGLAAAVALALSTATAWAGGDLFIYTWSDYTDEAMIEKFEKQTGIDVTIDTYDSNETALAKLQSGATGYDIVVPSQHFVEIMIHEDVLQKVAVHELPNYKNVEARWKNPSWDPEQEYSAPWHWGTASFSYRKDLYNGRGESLKEFFEPSEEVSGRLGVFEAPDEIVNLANLYLGIPFCSEDPKEMKKVQDLLLKQKPHVLMYNSEAMNDRLATGDVIMYANWNGTAMIGREEGVNMIYAYPKEGIVGWFDSLVVPESAGNVENARIFMNFMMEPENAAMQSNFTRYANAIVGSGTFMEAALKDAPEINAPEDVPVVFGEACSPKAQKLIDKVWTKLLQ